MGNQLAYGSVAIRHRAMGFTAWIVATLSFGIGVMIAGLATVGMTVLGFGDVPALTPADLVAMAEGRVVPHNVVLVFVVSQGLGILVQSAWLLPRAEHPVLAPVASVVAGWLIAWAVTPFPLPPAAVLFGVPVCQIVVIAGLIGRGPRYRS